MQSLVALARRSRPALATALLCGSASLLLSGPAAAVDGVIEINQAGALQGIGVGTDTAGFPVTLSESGSYRLTGNLEPTGAATDVIEVTADDVWIDLNGFSIRGGTVCTFTPPSGAACVSGGSATRGIVALGSLDGLVITDGIITGMTGAGVDATGSLISLQRIGLRSNGGLGVVAQSAAIERAVAQRNGGTGIRVGGGSTLTAVSSSQNQGSGLDVGNGSRLRDVAAFENAIIGINLGDGARLDTAEVANNGGSGIVGTNGVSVRQATSTGNGGAGIDLGAVGRVVESLSSANQEDGIRCLFSCTVLENNSHGNTGGGIGTDGFDLGGGSVVIGNTANINEDVGFRMGTPALYDKNHSNGHTTDFVGGTSMGTNVCAGVQC